MDKSELERVEFWTAAVFFLGGALSVSSPFASRFLRLSRLLRFDLPPSPWAETMLGAAGEDLAFWSDGGPLKKGRLPGG